MNLKNPLSWLSNGFGSGLSPIAPGTVGSLFAAIIFFFLINEHTISNLENLIFLLFIVVSFFLGIFIYPRTVEDENDPGSFVWDEFVGMWIACLPISILDADLLWLVLTFILFRIFDIWKLFGIKQIDQKHGALYVMLDDVLAGTFTAVIIFLLITFSV